MGYPEDVCPVILGLYVHFEKRKKKLRQKENLAKSMELNVILCW